MSIPETDLINYKTEGTCCAIMRVEVCDNIIKNAEFLGGCDGNLKGIKALVKGMHIDEVIDKFSGITCGDKNTSCPAQLANCLIEYKASKLIKLKK